MGTYVRDDVSVQVTLLTRNQNCNEDPRTAMGLDPDPDA